MKAATNQYFAFGIISLFVIAATRFWYFSTSTGAILTSKARAMYQEGNVEAAYQALDEALQLSRLDGNRRLLGQLAKLNTDLKRPSQAITAYEELFKLVKFPSIDQAKELLILYRESQRYEDAIAFILRADIQESIGQYLEKDLLSFYVDKGLYNLAVKILEKDISACSRLLSCTLENQSAKIFKLKLERADLLSWSRNFEESLKAYQELIETNPNDISLKERIAELFVWNNDFSSAADMLSDIINYKPLDLDIRGKQVHYLFWAKRFEEAEQIIKSMPDILNYDPSLVQSSVDHKLGNRDFKQAEEQLRNALQSTTNHTAERQQNLRLTLAEVLSWQGNYEDSLREYEILLSSNPDNIQLRRNYATVLSWAGKHRQSAIELKKTLQGKN